jgi:hypothetical protein
MRRILCARVACDNTIRLPWVAGVPPEEQLRFQSVTDCKYRRILEERNEWDIIVCYVSQTMSETNANNIIISILDNGKGYYSLP